MPLFEFDSGRLVPAQFGRPVTEPLETEVLEAVRDQVLELVQRPLFPVSWHDGDATDGTGGTPRLTAMDATGQAVTVEVIDRLDSVSLVSALSRAGRTSELGWLQLAEQYPRGVGAFRRDWNAFREGQPVRGAAGPRLIVVAGTVEPEVRPALEALSHSGVAVHEISVRQMSSGRRFLEVQELRPSAAVATDRVLAGRVQREPELTGVPGPAAAQLTHRYAEQRGGMARPHGANRSVAVPTRAPHEPEEHQPRVQGSEEDTPPLGMDMGGRDLAIIVGSLDEDTAVVWHQLRRGVRYDATLMLSGELRLAGGGTYADPTTAACAASGRDEVDGWQVWRFGEGGPSLADAWDELTRVPGGAAGDRHGRRRR